MTLSNLWFVHFGLVLSISAASSWLGVRWLIGYLTRRNIVDHVNERSMHAGVVPRGGGLVIVALVLICSGALAVFSHRPWFFLSFTFCIAAWAVLSWCDDRFDLSPKLRFTVQGVIAAITVGLFGWVGSVAGLNLGWIGPLFSVFGILWMANLNNFMDGMDGLAASQAIIGSLTLGVWFLYLGDWPLATLCAVVAAASYGFLLWNWQPARVFMGDVGSISLGALYATLMIVAANRHELPILSLLLIFGVFIADSTYTIINRIRKGEKFWLPHRCHFYQRAGLAGVKHSNVVMAAIVMMTICSLFATLSVLYRDIIAQLVILTLLLFFGAAFWVSRLEKGLTSGQ